MAGTENVEKGIRRGDAEVAVQALLRLSPAERAPFLEPVGALFRAAVLEAHEAKNWSVLTSWASRAEKISGLEGAGPESWPAQWALVWGAIKTKEWERAKRWYQPLHERLNERHPGFAAAMHALVSGSASPELLGRLVTPAQAADPRLGHEPKRQRMEWPLPRTAQEAEATLLALAGHEGWGVLAALVTQWAPRVDEPTRRGMLLLAGALAVRETVKRLASNASRPGEPTELLAFIVETLRAPPELSDEVLIMFRLMASRMPATVDAQAPTRDFTHAARAACAFGEHRALVAGMVTSLKFYPAAAEHVLGLLEHLVVQQPEPALVGKALALLSNIDPTTAKAPPRPPPAIVRVLTGCLAADAEAMSGWFNELPRAQRANLVQWMAFMAPIEMVQAFIVALWPAASLAGRGDLATMVEGVFYSLQSATMGFDGFGDALAGPVPKKARALWNATRDLVTTQSLDFLWLALREARDVDERIVIVTRGLSDRPPVRRVLELWLDVNGEHWAPVTWHVERLFLERFGRDLPALERAVLLAHADAYPLTIKRKLAPALMAVAQGANATPSLQKALALARRWAAGIKPKAERKPAKPRKPKKPRTPEPPDDDPIPF